VVRQVAARGEPWLTYFEPPTLGGDLRGIGFTRVEDLGLDEIHQRYFTGRLDGLRLNGIARLLKRTPSLPRGVPFAARPPPAPPAVAPLES